MKHPSIAAFVLALLLALCLSSTVFAAADTTATVPVTLTVANEYRAVNVTVPASLPVHVINGTVLVADNARIVNHSRTGAVRITGISVTEGAYRIGDYNSFSGSRTIALKINGCPTAGEGRLKITDRAFPVIEAGENQKLTYFAKVSGDAPNEECVNAANVMITISIAG